MHNSLLLLPRAQPMDSLTATTLNPRQYQHLTFQHINFSHRLLPSSEEASQGVQKQAHYGDTQDTPMADIGYRLPMHLTEPFMKQFCSPRLCWPNPSFFFLLSGTGPALLSEGSQPSLLPFFYLSQAFPPVISSIVHLIISQSLLLGVSGLMGRLTGSETIFNCEF